MAARIFLILLVIQAALCEEYRGREGLMDHLNNGMKFAKDFLGSESVALKVAEFVVKAFQTGNSATSYPRRKPSSAQDSYEDAKSQELPLEKQTYQSVNEAANPWSSLRHLVRLFGLQPTQISAVAVNALVFVAQMISTFLSGPQRQSSPYRTDDPTSWILNKQSKTLQDLLTTAKNESLPDIIENLVQSQGSGEDTSCIGLLVCKLSPFVTRMQKTVFGSGEDELKTDLSGASVMYRHLPTREEISEREGVCEQRFRDCDLND